MTSRSTSLTALSLFASLVLMSCGTNTTTSPVQVPGREVTTKSAVLEAGAAALQTMPPIQQLNLYLDGLHFAAADMGHQMEAHHYCAQLNEEVHQCALLDDNSAVARLIGVEYIISERLFSQLPSREKPFWHSHRCEMKSGQLIMPGIPTCVDAVPKDRPVATICGSGYRSSVAASLLQQRGYRDVANVLGGIGAWRRAGFETVSEGDPQA